MPRRQPPPHQPRRLPRQSRAKDTVEVILQAAAALFVAQGYDGASTNRIAEAAGVSIGTLYQYFPSKDAVLLQLSRRHSERMQEVFARRFAQAGALPLPAAIRLIIQAELEAMLLDLPLQQVLFAQVHRSGLDTHIKQVQAQVTVLLRQALAERSNELRPLELELAPFILLHAIDGVCQAALRERPELVASEQFLTECTNLALRYLSPVN